MKNKTVFIDPLSVSSLKLKVMFDETFLGCGTGFIIVHDNSYFLITNWHVVSGKNAETNECLNQFAAVPDKIIVNFHKRSKLGDRIEATINLYDDEGNKVWLEHPRGREVDVVAIRLPAHHILLYYYLDLSLADADIILKPMMTVSIIGYPLGLSNTWDLPIWKTGHIASDPDIEFDEKPAFLIDATTRGGMSGSPVILRTTGGYNTSSGEVIMSTSNYIDKFIGIYSGRIHAESEIGRIWRPIVIYEIIANNSAGDLKFGVIKF